MTTMGTALRAASRRPSRITLRVLAFNLLVLFLPVAGILYLDVYEAQLLATQERGMIEQARLAAAALGGRDSVTAEDGAPLLARLGQPGDARVRIYDATGALVADSVRVLRQPGEERSYGDRSVAQAGGRDRFLYRAGALLAALRASIADRVRRVFGPEEDSGQEPEAAAGPLPEVRAALEGRYGAATRPTPGQRSLTLSSAIPVRNGDTVTGAVVVSQSSFRILQALYVLRLRVFEVVIASIVLAGLLSLLMSATIVRPLVRLRRAAGALAERRTPLPGTFGVVERRDEIGDLARALDELALRLDAHIRLLESFAADVSHEFRNPLASIRTAAEMLASADDPADRQRFFAMLAKDVDRLERLVAGVRELARIDAQLAQEPPGLVDVGRLIEQFAEGSRLSDGATVPTVSQTDHCVVRADHDRLGQVFDNILRNARSFAPDGQVDISVAREGASCLVSIADRGPGIPPAHLERIFDRFFSYRPDTAGARQEHTGLGLAIARTIVEGYGGTISAHNRPGGGACFEVRLPLADAAARIGSSARSEASLRVSEG